MSGTFTLPNGVSLAMDQGSVVADVYGVVWKLQSESGWYGGPTVRGGGEGALEAHGQTSVRGWRGGRRITLAGISRGPNIGAAMLSREQVSSLLADGSAGDLIVSDPLGERRATVRLDGDPMVEWLSDRQFRWQVSLLAPDPRKYGPEQSVVTGLPEDTSALVFPLFSPSGVLEFGTPGSTGRVTLVNEGTADSWPVFYVTGPLLDGFELTELVTGARLRYVGPVGAGQSVSLDPRRGRVLLDGNADRRSSLVLDDWWAVPAGSSRQVRFASLGAFDPQARLVASLSSAWW